MHRAAFFSVRERGVKRWAFLLRMRMTKMELEDAISFPFFFSFLLSSVLLSYHFSPLYINSGASNMEFETLRKLLAPSS